MPLFSGKNASHAICRAILFCAASSVVLHSEAGPLSGFGAEGGLSLAHQEWEYKSDLTIEYRMKDWDSHGNAGLFVHFFHFNHFVLTMAIDYNQKGGLSKNGLQTTLLGAQDQIILGPYIDVCDRIDFLSFSPRAKFKYPLKKFEAFFSIGPSFDWVINKTSKLVNDDIFKNFEISALYGAGIGYSIKSHVQVFFEFLHQPSITHIYSGPQFDVTNDAMKFNIGVLVLP
jgi:hypothetical protein